MKLILDIPADVNVVEVIKDSEDKVRQIVLEPTFYAEDAKPTVFFTTTKTGKGKVLDRTEFKLAGTGGKIDRVSHKTTPVKPKAEKDEVDEAQPSPLIPPPVEPTTSGKSSSGKTT